MSVASELTSALTMGIGSTLDANHDIAVTGRIRKIPKNAQEKGKDEDGNDAGHDVVETIHP